MAKTKQRQLMGLIGWLLVVFIAAGIGAGATVKAGDFYTQLVRPEWAPPPSVFGPVWTLLYTLMCFAAWLVWRAGKAVMINSILILFLVQLAFNSLWSWLFFAWQLGALAFFDIVILWVLVVATLVAFWRVVPLAGILLVPYLLWVSFAAALNYSVWQLNPNVLG